MFEDTVFSDIQSQLFVLVQFCEVFFLSGNVATRLSCDLFLGKAKLFSTFGSQEKNAILSGLDIARGYADTKIAPDDQRYVRAVKMAAREVKKVIPNRICPVYWDEGCQEAIKKGLCSRWTAQVDQMQFFWYCLACTSGGLHFPLCATCMRNCHKVNDSQAQRD
eukprot:TRINITY_DN4369_c0_g1_i1.p2 TRINITY_DN4369_c0_g1~~TRINITY_DN4369_c0_g1_i1.p2  ORF type:complete len:164 (+),score=15.26 TRINITY_DN4369_c0_g1_i1:3-494(+)